MTLREQRSQLTDDLDAQFELPTAPPPKQLGGAGAGGGIPGMPDMSAAQMQQFQQMMASGGGGPFGTLGGMGMGGEVQVDPAADAEVKEWTTVYPIYLDAKRCYKKGCRRIPYAKSVLFPQSQHITAAVKSLGLEARHQVSRGAAMLAAIHQRSVADTVCVRVKPHKSHPQDWANPGRVKVRLTNDAGRPIKSGFPDSESSSLFSALPPQLSSI